MQVWVNGDVDANVLKIAQRFEKEIVATGPIKLKTFIVVVPGVTGMEGLDTKLKALGETNKLKHVALVYVNGPKDDGVRRYRINVAPEVKNTVFVYAGLKITHKFVNFEASDENLDGLCKEVAKHTVNFVPRAH